ncbi:MAG: hypothetical protein LBJ11_03135 [Oscillospiraceae bacterium]|jgi:hypothetical protein|nr:hypothetical protein [Oscillospiraceae bacterium]
MARNYGFYEAYLSDRLTPGKELHLTDTVYFTREKADISKYTSIPKNQLEAMIGDAEFAEQKIFERAKDVVREWEAAAGQTLLMTHALEYLKTPAVAHSGNEWQKGDYDYMGVSNAVYKMSYHVYENTRYDRALQKTVPVSWHLTWSVHTQNPGSRGYSGAKIAGQDKKLFTDKAAMEKYMQGRISAYAHLFTEVSPPVPKEHAHYFTVNGKLLPGYTVEGEAREQPAAVAEAKPEPPKGTSKPSMLGQLEKNKAEIKAATPPAKAQKLDKPDLS